MKLRVAARVPVTEVEGPGRRFALWVQGCTLRCPGCCNPEMFATRGGASIAVQTLLDEIDASHARARLDGITVLGGEPLEQLPGLAELARGVAARGLGVIVFTGYTIAQARARPGFGALWHALDTLVAGPFDGSSPEPDDGRRFVGSTNQTLEHRTGRYAAPSLWAGPREAEIHVDPAGGLRICGAPEAAAPLLRELRSRRHVDPT